MRLWQRGMIGFVLGCIAAGMLLVPQTAVQAQTAPTYDEAVGQLRLYVRYINERDFTRAYNLRSAGLRSRISLLRFASQFDTVNASEITIFATAATGDETVVYAKLVSIYADGTSRVLKGEYVTGFEGGRTRIFDPRLRLNGIFYGPLDEDVFWG